MDNIEEIYEILRTLAEANIDIELAINKIINTPDKYIEPFIREYMRIYSSQIDCLVYNIYKQIQRENPEVTEYIFEKILKKIEKEKEIEDGNGNGNTR